MELKKIYSPETIRLYLETGAKKFKKEIHEYLNTIHLNLLKRATFTPVTSPYGSYILVDVDVSPMDNSDSHKEGVSYTYKGHDGFTPIFTYIGTEGYMLDQELRPGKQHSQKGAPQYLFRTIDKLKGLSLPHPVLYRLDSGHDAYDTIRVQNRSWFQNPRFKVMRCWASMNELVKRCNR